MAVVDEQKSEAGAAGKRKKTHSLRMRIMQMNLPLPTHGVHMLLWLYGNKIK